MKKLLFLLLCLSITIPCFSQSKSKSIGDHIFLPALELGYVHNHSKSMSGGLLVKTSIEYRLSNINSFFFKINFDTHDSAYQYDNVELGENVINGTVLFSDLLGGTGYGFGTNKIRFFLLAQSGVKFYDFPSVTIKESTITINQESRNIFTSRATIGMEYYINDKSAISIDLFQNQIWNKKDFWNTNSGATGFSIGFITTLF